MSQKRAIFEDAGDKPAGGAPASTGGIDQGRGGSRGAVRFWLFILFLLVAAMIVVGGITRLTDSGLSIVEWNVVTGAMPPLSEADWQSEFDKYKTICEFTQQNAAFALADFKSIYWWEWGHRQLGRFVGLVWALGFFGFWALGKIPPGWTGRLFLVGVLGGTQGAIGWWMVSSGVFECRTDVSSIRLAIHLGLAFIILGVIAWFAFSLKRPARDLMQAHRAREPRLMAHGTVLAVGAFVQIILGALVAGIDAGRNYVDWPLMAGGILPPDMWQISPWWMNLIENDGTVQFLHRVWGYLVLVVALRVWAVARRSSHARTRRAWSMTLAALLAQVALGVVTVMNSAPLELGLAHQAVAILVWVLILRARHLAQYPVIQSIRG